jgi:CRISPR-associated protein Csx17
MEPRAARLLDAGRISEALAVSHKRLMVSGFKVFNVDYSNQGLDPARLLASLLIPVRDKQELEMMVMAKTDDEE